MYLFSLFRKQKHLLQGWELSYWLSPNHTLVWETHLKFLVKFDDFLSFYSKYLFTITNYRLLKNGTVLWLSNIYFISFQMNNNCKVCLLIENSLYLVYVIKLYTKTSHIFIYNTYIIYIIHIHNKIDLGVPF